MTVADLKRGEKGIIKDISADVIPMKLFEMGCLPGNEVEVIQLAPFQRSNVFKHKWIFSSHT